MKKNLFIVVLSILVCMLSCTDDNDASYAEVVVAKPLVISKTEFVNSIAVLPPQAIDESGKMYAYKEYIFVNDKYKGIHVIDNSNPSNPNKIGFIKIAGNVDISIKDDVLYADSLMDLLVFDITDIHNIKQLKRLENVLQDNVVWPAADVFEFDGVDYENEILVGWETVVERRKIAEVNTVDFALENASDGTRSTGQGGSLARFKIVSDYLYAVDNHNINIFDISNLDAPEVLDKVYAGFDIETIFNKGEYLFLGSMRGMYIYNIGNPEQPTLVSEFEHGKACDPVVVDDNYAYVTLRGGNTCGATESGLFIIDISNMEQPELKVMYPMDEPYGLGIKDDKLFVCDGASGLKVYDKRNVPDLPQLNHFKDVVTFDVIPLEDHLLMVGDGVLYQYKYLDASIALLSTFQLN
ncbi:LVIVD repeat-containing protein [Croceivirga sp. JEA036]|uniref:LVIVD repeat-containing protein n=1 Tax=Croceivirga sp. JEA036 TaxID=2721162 RepID=UPI00143944CA|nr:hypothetical protein [Croceivirga sp. JEA036]NJB36653.1 hypothetical protein [Croceivirga sp. JEA036]